MASIGRKVGLYYTTDGNVVREMEGRRDRRLRQTLAEIEEKIRA